MKHSWRKCIVTAGNHRDIRNNNTREKIKTPVLERSVKICSTQEVTSSAKKVKRFRSAFTTEQVTYLEKEFRKYPYIGNSRRKDVASVLDIPERAVKIWFQNRRMKEKKGTVMKEFIGESKRKADVEDKSHFFYHKKDQALSLPQLIPPNVTVTGNSLINMNQSELKVAPPIYLVQETVDNRTFHQSKSNISSVIQNNPTSTFIQPDYESKVFVNTLKTETNTSTTTSEPFSVHSQGGIVKSHQPPLRKVSERKLTTSPPSPSLLPEDLSLCRNADRSYDQKLFNEAKTQQQPSFGLTSVNTPVTGNPVYMRSFYPQPYMPPGNMIWKPLNMSLTSTGSSPEGAAANVLQFGSQPLPNGCKCDCHLRCNPMLFQQNGQNQLVQYFITAVPISGQPSV